MKTLTVEKLRSLEAVAARLGLSERVLIENASSNLAVIIDSLHLGKKVLVVAGKGNNGADALACARKLVSRNYIAVCGIVSDIDVCEEVAFQKSLLDSMRVPVFTLGERSLKRLSSLSADCDFILDGLLGIGIRGIVSPLVQKAIKAINDSKRPVVSCDIPSGLSPDEGIVSGSCVQAAYTITFLAPKPGFFINQGPQACGEVIVADIGISRDALEAIERNGR